jgi:DNA-binding NtrC family response regulator
MRSAFPCREISNYLAIGNQARVLLLGEDLRDLVRDQAILKKLGCRVFSSSSFAEGLQHLGREEFDLIILYQGGRPAESYGVLMRAMEIDGGYRVLILARSFDKDCCCQALQLGALDYFEAP